MLTNNGKRYKRKHKVRIPMLREMGPELHRFQGQDQKTNGSKDRARIPLSGRRRSENR